MDIEERAERWARNYSAEHDSADVEGFGIEDLMAAFLAGSSQGQADYSKYLACPRCECSCGAR
jgi:hypothetical protein